MHAPILQKETLAPGITRMVVAAPQVAAHAAAGQFVILRAVPEGERIPLTIADFDAAAGTVTVIYQVVGGTTLLLDSLLPGDCLPTFAGPLGRPSEVAGFARAAVIGGGLGCAIALPTAAALTRQGCRVTVIAGFRSRQQVIYNAHSKGIYHPALITYYLAVVSPYARIKQQWIEKSIAVFYPAAV